jgi:CheY-like chemotaxis protein
MRGIRAISRAPGPREAYDTNARLRSHRCALGCPLMNNSLQGVEILVVEDDADARELFEELFQGDGAIVRAAGSIAEALTLLRAWEPTVLVTDISLSDGDGYAFLARVRALRPDVPAIAITGYVSDADKDRAKEAGFQHHVSKPIDVDDLLAAVLRVASRTQAV